MKKHVKNLTLPRDPLYNDRYLYALFSESALFRI